MATEAQRAVMLAAMGIEVYRLRTAPSVAAPLCIALDGHACVCVDGEEDDSVERLCGVLPAALGVARERVLRGAVAADGAIVIDVSALRGNAAVKRALWETLKPLARRLQRIG